MLVLWKAFLKISFQGIFTFSLPRNAEDKNFERECPKATVDLCKLRKLIPSLRAVFRGAIGTFLNCLVGEDVTCPTKIVSFI